MSDTDKVNLAELRSLGALCELYSARQALSMKQAAKKLPWSPETLSTHIGNLNRVFGELVKLNGSGVLPELTSLGRAAEPLVRRIARSYADLVALQEQECLEMRIGCSRPVWPLVVQLLTDHHAGSLPIADANGRPFAVTLRLLDNAQQTAQLLDGQLHVAIGYATDEMDELSNLGKSAEEGKLFNATVLLQVTHCVLVVPRPAVVKRDHPAKRELRPAELCGLTYLALPKRRSLESFHDAVDKWFDEKGIRPGRRLETKYAIEIASAAAIGSGFGFLPRLWEKVHAGQAEFMDDVRFPLGSKLAIYVDRSRAHAMSGFVSRLKRLVGEHLRD